MSALYDSHILNPEATVVSENLTLSRIEIEFVEPFYGWEAIYVSDSPFWFQGFRQAHGTQTFEFLVSEPVLLPEIPEDIKMRRNDLQFTESEETLRRHMVFL